MECPNCKHCINTSSTAPGKNDSPAIIREEVVEEDRVKLAVVEEVGVKGKKVLEAPCVVCFVPVVGVADRSKIFEPLTPEEVEEDKIFQWFLLNFRVEPPQHRKQFKGQRKDRLERFDELVKYRASGGWDGEGGRSPPLPICEECRNEVVGLMEWKNRIKSIGKGKKAEKDGLREGLLVLRRKMGRCEPEYVSSGIYEKDKRYYRVRRTIISVLKGNIQTLRKEGFFLKERVKEEVGVEVLPHQMETRRTVVMEVEVPCVICCETLKLFPEEKTMKEKDEDKRVFRWFLRHFENLKGQLSFPGAQGKGKFGKKRKHLRGVKPTNKIFWDGMEGKSEPLQFCWGCREGIKEWFDLKLTSPQTKVELGREVKRIRKRMKECEYKFLASGIYKRDQRYFNVRRNVVNVLETEVVSRIPPPPQPPLQKKKRRKMEKKIVMGQKLLKNQMDKILGEGFGMIGGQQQGTEVFMEGEGGEEECDEKWVWEDEEEPATIGQWKEGENLMGMDPLGLDTEVEAEAMEIETGYHERFEVKQEEDLEEDEDDMKMDFLGHEHGAGVLEDENQKGHYRNCLLCYKSISKKESALAPVLTNDLNEQNLNSMFILRKMLNVPEERLVGYLENFGCPGKWLEFCKNCLGMVDAALRIQKEINRLEEKLRSYQDKMVQKIKGTLKENGNISKEKCEKLPDEITRITEETRQFVSVHERKILKKKVTRRPGPPRPVFVLPPPPPQEPEVAKVSNEYDNKRLEPQILLLPPPPLPSLPDDSNSDSSYFDDTNSPESMDDDLDLKPRRPSSEKRIKLTASLKEIGERSLRKMKATLNEKEYTCSLCPTIPQPMTLEKFYKHVIFHKKRPFKCSICNVYWSSALELTNNPFVDVKENPINEHVCSEGTLVKVPPEDGKFNPGRIWKCEWCTDRKFEMETERDSHEEEEHLSLKIKLEMKFKCLACSKAYRSYREWLLHRVLEHPKKAAISCLFCDYTSMILGTDLINTLEMREHVNLEHSPCTNLFVGHDTCDFCGVSFGYSGYKEDKLGIHVKEDHNLASGLFTYSCPSCYYRTGYVANLRRHFKSCRVINLPPPSPSACKKVKAQGQVGSKDNCVICDICGKKEKNRVQLCDHKMVNHGKEPKEMEEYKGEKILNCGGKGNECGGYRTLLSWKMRVHMMQKHGTERKWKCGECGKGFTSSSKLSRHKEIHNNKGLRPYQCEICGNSFAVKNYLYIHMRLSHQNRPFASTNRKRTPKKGTSNRVAKIGNVDSEGVGATPTPVASITTDLPPARFGTTVDSAMEGVSFN